MTLQQQWGSVGMALALTTIVGVCGAGVAQTATTLTPPHVSDLTPALRAMINYFLNDLLGNDAAFSDTADKTKTLGFAADQSLAMNRALDHATLDLYTTATTAEGTPIPTEATQLTELIFQESIRFNNPLILRRHSNETITGTAWFRAIGPWQAGTGSVTATDNVAVILGAEGVPASFRSAGQNAFSSIVVSGPTQLFLDAGATSIGALTIDDPTELFVGDGDTENGAATLTLTGGIAEDGDTLSATVNADGTLVMGANGAFWPKDRTLTVVGGGTVTTTPSTAIALTFEQPTPQSTTLAIAPIPALAVNDGATLRTADTASSLSIDALKGFGEVFFIGSVSIGTLHLERGQEMTLDRAANDTVAGSTTLGQVSGEGATVRFGLLGDNGTTGVQAVCDALTAGGFQGTVAFLPTDYPVVDFAQTAVTELPCTLAVQPGQTLVIRLDQYVDADIVWPEAPETATLQLVEAGPFGGEASLPAWPANVDMEFVRYGDATTPYTPIPETDFTADANDDGVTIDLSWQNPVLTGKVAWVDMEFNGDSRNTGWLVLNGLNGEPSTGGADYNGMLRGDIANGSGANEIIDGGTSFETAWNPQSEAVDIHLNPYLSVFSIEYPEQWTMVSRIMMPQYSNTAGITIGANYVAPGIFDGSPYGVLALATGAIKNDRSDNDTEGDELILWFIPNNDNVEDMVKLASVMVPCITDSYHLVTIRYDRGHVEVFLNENRLIDVMLPEGTKIGPGLQFGRLMGSSDFLDEGIAAVVRDVETSAIGAITDPGEVDFLRIYRGLLTDTAFQTLVRQYPYIHKEEGTAFHGLGSTLDIRYVRELTGGTEDWVDPENKPWRRQFKGGTTIWTNDGWYAEPAEGSIVLVECDDATTLSVNTAKHGVFPSKNRTYAQLIVTGSGTLTLEPCEGWETPNEDGSYAYGRLVFSGGQGDKAAQHEGESDEENGGGTDAAYFYADANIRASVCDLSRDGVSLKDNNTVAIHADEGLMRGEEDTSHAVKQLTGPVSGSGTFVTSTSTNEKYGQRSDYVVVDYFDPDEDHWLINDITVANNGTIDHPPRMDTGLFAEFTKIPGILYLELAQDALDGAEGPLSEQEWHRFGYNGDDASETDSGLAPELALPQDFARADGLCIRLKEGTADTLRVDADGAVTLPFLVVEAPKDDGSAEESLAILPSTGGDRQITFSEAIATARPLTVYDATSAGNSGADGIGMKPHEVKIPDTTGGTVTLIQGGTRLYGEGPYRAGKTTFAYDLDGSTLATLESLGELTFSAEQSLPETDLVATPGASIVQAGADAPFAVKSLTLQGEGSTFRFNSTAVDVAESLSLATDAVLDCTQLTEGAAPTVRDVVTDDETGANIDVLLPSNAQDGLVFLQSEEPDFNWIARARLLASSTADLQITRWDVRLDHEGIDGTNYRIATPNLDVPNFDDRPEDIPEEDRPGESENEWPEGSEDEIVEDIIIDGHIAGEAEGYTKANTQWLMAPDIANAYACFGKVWTLAPRSVDPLSEDYATRDLLMAYEFGISRMAFTQDGNHILIEATLRNALADCDYFTDEQLQGAGALEPIFLPGVKVDIVGKDGNPLANVKEITETEAKAHGFTPNVSDTETARWFLVPYDEANFHTGEVTHLTVKATPPAE